MATNPEHNRLADNEAGKADWSRWGPYLSERSWGTVREDYSANGDAWNYFPHDHARSRAYRWNEDGLGGFCDYKQNLCLAIALWNEKDMFLKERMFGLTNQQGNHGEDVKEYYFFLDGTPTHSYMKMLYKYPQAAYPYAELVEVNDKRTQAEPEYELFDALPHIFLANRYFDVFIEYAKADPEDILCRITSINRGPEPAPIHVLPHLWYRNIWTWEPGVPRSLIKAAGPGAAYTEHDELGERWWYVRAADNQPIDLLFTENETNLSRLYRAPNPSPYVKDGINEAIVGGSPDRVNKDQGSKLAGHTKAIVAPGGIFTVEVRFTPEPREDPFGDFAAVFTRRIAEADEFYHAVHPPRLTADERLIQRQAFAGLLWSKQFYNYDVFRWLSGDPTEPKPPEERWHGRNHTWKHLSNEDVILMPDTWEYPWYASWDLAFHCVALSRIDSDFAKKQLLRMGYEWYQHGNGQYPAYEWNFNDVNPPVLAWAALAVYRHDRELKGQSDYEFLAEIFHSLMLNYSWWINRKDMDGRDIFGGGFLGMDNIGVFDRDQPLPDGSTLEQSDGTSWMAKLSLSMFAIATELSPHDSIYEAMAVKYFEHFLNMAHAMTNIGGQGIDLWDEQDQFFYDVIHHSSGNNIPLKIRTMVGLTPLFAVLAFNPARFSHQRMLIDRIKRFESERPDLFKRIASLQVLGNDDSRLVAILNNEMLKAVLRRVFDSSEFLSDYGIRSLSAYYRDHPYVFEAGGKKFLVRYLPQESDSRLFGGNSNWRGPIWFPVNYLLVRALQEFNDYYGDTFKVEYPTGSGRMVTLGEAAQNLASRLGNIFLRDPVLGGRRAVWGDNDYFQTDPHWRDYIPFHEYFNGDTGAGAGASHQTGWTALIASLLMDVGKSERNAPNEESLGVPPIGGQSSAAEGGTPTVGDQ
jgi:mannosylglycerate hydrolase MGH1-like protein